MKKKVLALFLAATMTMGMGMTVMAAEDTYTISITEAGSVAHTYNVYQIFAGTYSETEVNGVKTEILADIKWGSNVDAQKGITVNGVTYKEAQDFAEYLQGLKDADLEAIRNDIYASLVNKTTPVDVIVSDTTKTVKSDKLPAGYYFLEDVTEADAIQNDTYSSYIIQVLGNVTVAAKSGTVTSTKKVDDVNDSTGVKEENQDTADYDIGDIVPFTLTGTIPSNYDKYETYKYAFHDKMDAGLTFKGVDSISVDGVEITEGFTVVTNPADGCTFDIVFDDMKTVSAVKANSTITVKYSAELNENCVRGEQGNLNTSWITYSNNPNAEGEGKTPDDNTIVFTYEVVVNKVDQDSNPLSGAEFEISKFNFATKTFEKCDVVVNTDGDQFTVDGIDDGVYMLVETVAPTGYNKLEDAFYFVVDAKHAFNGFIDETQRNEILSLDAYEAVWNDTNFASVKKENNVTIQFTANKEDGIVSTDVVNKSGSLLPSTGGIGTTVFYVFGGVCVLGGGALLFTKKRMSREEA